MPVFKSLAEFLVNLSPLRSQQSEDRPSAVQPAQPPRSTPPLRSRRSSRNHLNLGSDTVANYPLEPISPQRADPTTHPKVCICPYLPRHAHGSFGCSIRPSTRELALYVDTFPSPTGPTTAGSRLHPRFPNPILGPFAQSGIPPRPFHTRGHALMYPSTSRLGDSSQMLDKDQRNGSRDRRDEARLLGARYHDSQAVKIKPGATFQSRNKKPGVSLSLYIHDCGLLSNTQPQSSFAFSPRDKLSQNSRSSGPVRAHGEPKISPTSIRRNPLELEDSFEESSRPSKRRRQSETSETIDLTAPTDPALGRVHQKGSRRTHHPEPKEVVNDVHIARYPLSQHDLFFSGDLRDERFTENAAQQRRRMAKAADSRLSHANSKPTQRAEPPGNIEIGVKKSVKKPIAAPSDTIRRPTAGRESPDELQGDTTTHPVPKSLAGKGPRTTRQSIPEVHIEVSTRKRSPSDIRPTDFSSPSQGTKKAKTSHRSFEKRFSLYSFQIGSLHKTCVIKETVPIYSNNDGLELRGDVLDHNDQLSIPFEKFSKVIMGQSPSRKVRIELVPGSVEAGDQLDLEFWRSEEKRKFGKMLSEEANPEIISKDRKWMDRAFVKYATQFCRVTTMPKKRHLDEDAEDPGLQDSPPARRPKLSDSLRDDHGGLGNGSLQTKRIAKDKGKLVGGDVTSRKPAKERVNGPIRNETDTVPDIPVKPLGYSSMLSDRETRSSTRRVTKQADSSNKDSGPEERPLFGDDSFREIWKKPLVYPRTGKKKAEVNLEDRDRLRTDDFLNDNLIAFYMRFLQDHLERTNPEAAKRVYFFNSYFFATLTNTPKGDRGINYTGVEKWTRNVDLFSYDYIVVPINENAHWYVAIICNLPTLSLDSADRKEHVQPPTPQKSTSNLSENVSENEVHQIQETPEPESESASSSDTKPQKSADQASKEAESENIASGSTTETGHAAKDTKPSKEQSPPVQTSEESEYPFLPTNIPKAAAQKLVQEGAAELQKHTYFKKRAGLRLDPNQTTIVTFDSLDAPRSPTIKLLRDYICREAASKRGVELDPSEIKGMRARDIPLQPNYCDCGLYLLTYVERFVQSPDYFIAKVLQRTMNATDDWPPLGSGLLRSRFGKFLDQLYEEQEQADGPALVNKQPISFLLGPPLPSQKKPADTDVVPESEPEPDASKKPTKKAKSSSRRTSPVRK
ncbi:Peptidase C48 SUMO/Sentrin/Ubl1 [Penicillium bovifimosum]|uniref:Peptidase C48 SUMO/Sentrin/Ubl1 n=1 Tax=Penicillium bovifimosum TaxID=126998 RepID=A0A9W9HGN0_9EURO|nr:Peptidase C48 SUMO/Sentrin/Ubl1 [Penicillium bovifimosum]KAJ5146403.1 Peptidase C48 SUMO/Sentrin/Ubl1 [Penicillium bovifimosum]